MPTFSIIVPCYNQEEYLSECLNSVLSQSCNDWECIIVDDGSTDNSAIIAKKYAASNSMIKYIFQENRGVAAARNRGIENAAGIYILPLDGDDKIGSEYLSLAYDAFKKNPEIQLLYCKAKLFGIVDDNWLLPAYDYNNLLFQNSIFCSAIFKKDDFYNSGGYDESMTIGYEDWEFLIRFLNKKSVVFQIDSVQFYYRQRQQSRNTFIEDEVKHQQIIDYIFRKNKSIYFNAIGYDETFFGSKNLLNKHTDADNFKKTFTYKTFYKLEKEINRIRKRFKK